MKNPYTLTIFFVFLANIGIANSGVADLSVSVKTNEFTDLRLGSSGTIELLVTNYGPDIAGIDAPTSGPIALNTEIFTFGAGNPIAIFRNESISQDCFFSTSVIEPRPPNKPGFFYSVNISPIQVNETVSCLVDYVVLINFDEANIEWDLSNPLDTDPIDTNNQATVSFFGAPVKVPAFSNLSIFVSILLFLFFLSKSRAVAKIN